MTAYLLPEVWYGSLWHRYHTPNPDWEPTGRRKGGPTCYLRCGTGHCGTGTTRQTLTGCPQGGERGGPTCYLRCGTGHCGTGSTRQALTGNPQGGEREGSPRKAWSGHLEAETQRLSCSWGPRERIALNWNVWRALVGGLGSSRGQRH